MPRTALTKPSAALLACLLLTGPGCSLGTGVGMGLGLGFSQVQSIVNSANQKRKLLFVTRLVRVSPPPTAPLPRELDKAVHSSYLIEPGDKLLVEPVSADSPLKFPGEQVVLSDGTIDLGAYGRVAVAGATIEQIEAMVQSIVREGKQGKAPGVQTAVNVQLTAPASKVFYVDGEVKTPGAFPLSGRETVLDAVMAAGGLTSSADPCKIVLARPTSPTGCRVVLAVCYNQIVQLGDASTNYQIMPGDRIFVASRPWWWGLVPGLAQRSCPFCNKRQTACGNPNCSVPFSTYAIPPGGNWVPPPDMERNEPLPNPPLPPDGP